MKKIKNPPCIYMTQCMVANDVDIVMMAYNHGEYIAKALDSILMQKTRYTYRIIIGEDCSGDNTRQIIMNYYKQYADRMELYLWKKNIGMLPNAVNIMKGCSGKYVAFLEGDDYWTDPLKLEKQISFLENHPEFIGTAHNVREIDKNGNSRHTAIMYPIQEEHIYGVEQAMRWEMAAQTASLLYRNIHKDWREDDWEKYASCKANGDLKINIILGLSGDIFYFRDIMAHHRRVFAGDSWTAKTFGKNILWLIYMFRKDLQRYIEKTLQIKLDIKPQLDSAYKKSCEKVLIKPNRENIDVWRKLFAEKLRRRKHGV